MEARENELFLTALCDQLDVVRKALADEWPFYLEALVSFQQRSEAHEDNAEQFSADLDELLDLLLESPARELIRKMLEQSLTQAGVLNERERGATEEDPVAFSRPAPPSELPKINAELSSKILNHASQEQARIQLYYATDRKPTLFGYYGGERGKLELGEAEVTIPVGHQIGELEGPRWWRLEFSENPDKHVVVVKAKSGRRDAIVNALRESLQAAEVNDLLVFIHGFNVTFSDALRRTAQLAHDLDFPGVPVAYSWPSKGSLWKYMADGNQADWTVPHLRQVLELLCTQTDAKSVHVIAHSMGNRALVDALQEFDHRALPTGAAQLSQVVLAAPDIDADVFRQLARKFPQRASRFTLYASSRDYALRWSKRFNGNPRAGDTGEQIVVVKDVDTIDSSHVDTSFWGQHSYYGEDRSILSDLFALLHDDKSPPRFGMDSHQSVEGAYWVFNP